MVISDILNVKLNCLRIYYYIEERAKFAQNEVAAINCGEIDHESILNVCNQTVEFANKIVHELENFTNSIKDDIANLEGKQAVENENVQVKKDCNTKKSIFSLKKEANEELTQDEFLEIYKIDMTENLNSRSQKARVFENIANENDGSDNNSTEDERNNSDGSSQKQIVSKNTVNKNDSINSDSISTQEKENKNVEADNISKDNSSRKSDSSPSQNETIDSENLNEIDILKKIGCDSSEYESDSESLFSCSTVLLDQDITESNAEENEEYDRNVVEDIQKSKESIHENAQSDLDSEQSCRKEKDKTNDDTNDKEMKEIENLTNLDSLKRKRNSSEHIRPRKKKKKDKNEIEEDRGSNTEESYNSSSDLTTDCEQTNDKEEQEKEVIITKDRKSQDGNEVLNFLLNCMSDVSDLIVDTVSDDSTTDVEKSKSKKCMNKKVNKSDKQNESKVNNENADVNEDKKKKKWRRHKLLTEKFMDVSSDNDNEKDPKQERKKRKLRSRTSITIKSEKSTCSESDRSSGSESVGSVTDYSQSSVDSSSSDLELITTSKPDLVLQEEEETEKTAEVDVKTGRRNIRTVQSDASLAAITKKALREEEERRDRLQKQVQLVLERTEEDELVLDVDKTTKEPLIVVDKDITRRLKDHQREGVRFMWNCCYETVERLKTSAGSGCILAHCMGLGKTLQVIALIDTLFTHQETNTNHVLIVCPLSTVLNWENEFKKTYSEIAKDDNRIKRYIICNEKSKQERHRTVKRWYRNKGVLIIGYDSFQGLLKVSPTLAPVPKAITEALLDPGPDLIVCDEGHLIKNGNKNRAKTLMKVKTKRRIILTGTPMQNNLTEYYHMVNFVKPQVLGTRKEFNNRFVNPIVNGGYHDSTDRDIKVMRKRCHVLHEYLKGTVQRYEMSELQTYLPDKLDYVLYVKPHPLQAELYKAYLDTIDLSKRKRKEFFVDFGRLRDVSTHPCILRLKERKKQQNRNDPIVIEPEIGEETPGEWWRSRCPDDILTNIEYGPKIKVMFEIIEHCNRLNDKVLIFTSDLTALDAIEFFLEGNGWKKNISYLRMDGKVPAGTRKTFCDKFNDTKADNPIKLFLLTHRVGGIGLNLVAANRIILMDVNFNPAVDSQSIFRTYRFGQNKRCHVYRLVSLGTLEEVLYERSITKLAISLRVVDEHQTSRHYASRDLKKMFRFKMYNDDQRPVLRLPADDVLASILEKCKMEIFKYHEHQDLLENRPEEQLNEEEQKSAWEEFRREQTGELSEEQKRQQQQQTVNLNQNCTNIPKMSAIRITPCLPSTSNTAPMNPSNTQPMRPNNNFLLYKPKSSNTLRSIRQKRQNPLLRPPTVYKTVNLQPLSSTATNIGGRFNVRQKNFNIAPNTTASNVAQSARLSNGTLAIGPPLFANRFMPKLANNAGSVLKIQNIRPKPQALQNTAIPNQGKRTDVNLVDRSSESVPIIDLEADSPVKNSKEKSKSDNKNNADLFKPLRTLNENYRLAVRSPEPVTVIDLDETDSYVNHSQDSPTRDDDSNDSAPVVEADIVILD